MNVAWHQREEARRSPRAELHSRNLRKAVKTSDKNLRKVHKDAVLSFLWAFASSANSKHEFGKAVKPASTST